MRFKLGSILNTNVHTDFEIEGQNVTRTQVTEFSRIF